MIAELICCHVHWLENDNKWLGLRTGHKRCKSLICSFWSDQFNVRCDGWCWLAWWPAQLRREETAMETTQPWLSAPSQQPCCLCPTVQVWKISTLVIICFTWQNLLLQLMTQMHYCQKDCCLVRYRHYKGIQLHLAFLQGFPCIKGSWGFLWTIWCLLYCAHTSPACELTYSLACALNLLPVAGTRQYPHLIMDCIKLTKKISLTS